MSTRFTTYIVSLLTPEEVLARPIGDYLSSNNVKSVSIFGVDGRLLSAADYFISAVEIDGIMTPGEVGCKLSHLHILKCIYNSSTLGLVFEDDVLPPGFAVFPVLDNLPTLSEDKSFILFLGGLDGTSSQYRMLGKPLQGSPLNIHKLHPLSSRWLLRTCCYLISPAAASALLKVHSKSSYRVDDWARILEYTNIDIYYTPLFRHPLSLSASQIEPERRKLFKSRLRYSRGPLLRVFVQVRSAFQLLYLLCLGYRPVLPGEGALGE